MAETIADDLLGVLMGNPDKTFSAEDLASLTGWTPKQCTGALARLCNTYLDVLRPTRGLYWYHPERQAYQEDLEPVQAEAISQERRTRDVESIVEPGPESAYDGGGALKVLRSVTHDPLPDVVEADGVLISVATATLVPTIFEAMGTDEKDRVVLRDDKHRMWVATRLKADLG